MNDNAKGWICFIAAAIALGWSVFVFGGVADGYRTVAGVLTVVAGLLCLVLLPGRRRLPPIPWVLAGAVLVLLAFGWFMVLNAVADHSLIDWQFTANKNRILEKGPGSVASSASIRALLELTMVCVGLFAALRASESGAWKRLLELLAVMAALVALTGMLHKAGGAETVYWMDDRQPATIFAPYLYCTNAGQFMNVGFALAFSLALARVGDDQARSVGIFWTMVAVVIAAGVLASASKGATIILLISLPLLVVWNRRRFRELFRAFRAQRGRRLERTVLVVSLTVLAVLLVVVGLALVITRWEGFFARFGDPNENITGREVISKLMWAMAGPDEGSWHGFGPGTFRHLIPYFTKHEAAEGLGAGRWFHGHCDPLQTLVEWGWVGAAAWFTIGAGAVLCGLILLLRRRLSPGEVPLVRGMVVALSLLGLHSCVDFPLSIYSIHLTAMVLCGICWGLLRRRAVGGGQKAVSRR